MRVKYTIYTDGSCLKNPGGAGGWAAVIQTEGERERTTMSGGEASTTNNRMELMAAIQGLRGVAQGATVTLISDSQYVVRGMNEWSAGWASKGWARRNARTRTMEPIPNADLWKTLLAEAEVRDVEFVWVRGHDGNPLNELADHLAGEAAAEAHQATMLDEGDRVEVDDLIAYEPVVLDEDEADAVAHLIGQHNTASCPPNMRAMCSHGRAIASLKEKVGA